MNIENQTLKKKTKNKFSLGHIQKEPYILNSLEGVMLKNNSNQTVKIFKIFCIVLDDINEGKSCKFCTFFVVVLQVQLIKHKERERSGWVGVVFHLVCSLSLKF